MDKFFVMKSIVAIDLSKFLSTVVHKIWGGQKEELLWSQVGPYKLFTKNLQEQLALGKLVESEVSKFKKCI